MGKIAGTHEQKMWYTSPRRLCNVVGASSAESVFGLFVFIRLPERINNMTDYKILARASLNAAQDAYHLSCAVEKYGKRRVLFEAANYISEIEKIEFERAMATACSRFEYLSQLVDGKQTFTPIRKKIDKQMDGKPVSADELCSHFA